MVERAKRRVNGGGNYWSAPKTDVQFIPSGCRLLDLALGGGWAENRIANIVGDKSTGKTLLAIEACANFAMKYKKSKGNIRYRECEAAFSNDYAQAIGMPIERVDFGTDPIDTVEDLFEDLTKIIEGARGPELCIVDSLDALSDRGEMSRAIDAPTFGQGKPKMMSQLFRRLVRGMARKQVTLIIISQVRTAIGVTFGDKTSRSGGRALDFYASQVPYLSYLGKVSQTIQNQERATAIKIRTRVKKNKVGPALRDAEFKIRFGFGIDDHEASINFMDSCGRLEDDLGITKHAKQKLRPYYDGVDAMDNAAYQAELARVHAAVTRVWYEIEKQSLPTRVKYNHAAAESAR